VKEYLSLRQPILAALQSYAQDVQARRFPAPEHTYPMPEAEAEAFLAAPGEP